MREKEKYLIKNLMEVDRIFNKMDQIDVNFQQNELNFDENQLNSESISISESANYQQTFFSVNHILRNDYNCDAVFFTWTFPNEGTLEEQWEKAFKQLEFLKTALPTEHLVAGGIFSVEPHKNTTLKSKRGKNTKAGKPHFHAVIWFSHRFFSPSLHTFKLMLSQNGISTRADELDTPLDEIKTLLYVVKEKNEESIQDLCEAFGHDASIFVWAPNSETRNWFVVLYNAINAGGKATFQEQEENITTLPTTKRHCDDALLLAELFGKVFEKGDMAVRDNGVYEKVNGLNFCFQPREKLDNWLSNCFNIKQHQSEYSRKLKDNVNWLSKQGLLQKQGARRAYLTYFQDLDQFYI
jgi:hypothetical protein